MILTSIRLMDALIRFRPARNFACSVFKVFAAHVNEDSSLMISLIVFQLAEMARCLSQNNATTVKMIKVMMDAFNVNSIVILSVTFVTSVSASFAPRAISSPQSTNVPAYAGILA